MKRRFVALALFASCGASGTPTSNRIHDVGKAPLDGTPVRASVAVGDAARLRAPPIVIHPDFLGAKIIAEYDPKLLDLEDRRLDKSVYGQRTEIFTFRARSQGTAEVVLRLSGTAQPIQRTAKYVLEVGP